MKYFLIALCLLLSFGSYGQKATSSKPAKVKQAAPVCESPEEKAYYPYGKDSLDRYIKLHMHFRDVGDKITGKATVAFIVETDGSIKNAEILSSSGNKDFDTEAVRVVKTIPGWKPAKNKGKVVRASDMLSVVFNVR